MRARIVTSLLSTALAAGPALAGTQISTFTDAAQFAAATAAHEMRHEDFEAADIAPSTSASIASPLSSASSNAVFSAGSIVPGVEIHSVPAPGSLRVLGLGSEYFSIGPAASKLIAVASNDTNAFDLLFSPPATAVGLTVFGESDSVGISYFGSGGLLAALPVAAPDDSGGFFGMLSSEPIVRVRVNAPNVADSGNFEGIDDLSFGQLRTLFTDGFESGAPLPR